MTLKSCRDLDVWQQSMDLVVMVYRLAARLPADEKYGLQNQMRRCAVSIPANIAEGAARDTTGEFLRFLHIARGSLAELETQILIAHDLEYLEDSQSLLRDLYQVSALLDGLIRSLKARPTRVRDEEPDYDEVLNATK